MTAPYQKSGKWWLDRDPDDNRYTYGDVSQDLLDMGTTAASVVAITANASITLTEAAIMQGNVARVKTTGLDMTAGVDNYVTFRVTCANGEQFDRTIWFSPVEN